MPTSYSSYFVKTNLIETPAIAFLFGRPWSEGGLRLTLGDCGRIVVRRNAIATENSRSESWLRPEEATRMLLSHQKFLQTKIFGSLDGL
jgi:hypothetical protein